MRRTLEIPVPERATTKSEKKIETVPVEQLRFDPHNPRLPSMIDGTDERRVLEWMLAEGNIPELMASIGTSGYFPGEPLLVVAGTRKDTWVVCAGSGAGARADVGCAAG
jgi:hypothetical protein